MAVEIDIVGSFSGKKAFKEADTAMGALTKSASKLVATLGLARLAQKSLYDAMADEKSIKVLAQNLKNVGLAYAQIPAERFIKTLQDQTGILDDQLRPAYAQIARVTGSIAKTQELLALAFDVSRGSGADYSQVIDALSQAYVGNVKGLKALNIGLTQSELKSKSFAEITAILNKEFGGAGAASLDTYAGKLDILRVTAANASETIGGALLNSLSNASGSNGFGDFISKVNTGVNALAKLITYVGRGAEVLNILGGAAQNPTQALKDWKALRKRIAQEDKDAGLKSLMSGITTTIGPRVKSQAEIKAEADAARRNKELLALQKSANKLATNNLKLQKAAAVFDMKKIQITAALKAAMDEETITRLKLMLAIENEQVDLAVVLQKKLDEIISKNKTLQIDLNTFKNGLTEATDSLTKFTQIKINPFDFTGVYKGITDLDALKAKVTEVTGVFLSNATAMASFSQGIAQGLSISSAIGGARYAGQGAGAYVAAGGNPIISIPPLNEGASTGTPPAPTVVNNNITVNGATDAMATARSLDWLLKQSASMAGDFRDLGFGYVSSVGATP